MRCVGSDYRDHKKQARAAREPVTSQGKQRRKRHHYVPETYLQAWSDENDRIAMRLRGTNEVKVTATKNIAVESDLYTMRGIDGEPDDFLEKALGDMVDGPAAVPRRLRQRRGHRPGRIRLPRPHPRRRKGTTRHEGSTLPARHLRESAYSNADGNASK